MGKILTLSAVLVVLVGCGPIDELREARQQKTCADMGAPPGSPNYYDCRMHLHEDAQMRAMAADSEDDETGIAVATSRMGFGAYSGSFHP